MPLSELQRVTQHVQLGESSNGSLRKPVLMNITQHAAPGVEIGCCPVVGVCVVRVEVEARGRGRGEARLTGGGRDLPLAALLCSALLSASSLPSLHHSGTTAERRRSKHLLALYSPSSSPPPHARVGSPLPLFTLGLLSSRLSLPSPVCRLLPLLPPSQVDTHTCMHALESQ